MRSSDLGARLLAAFFEDFEEQKRSIEADLLALEVNPSDEPRLHSLFRAAHTLKGAARAANLPLIEGMWHALEDRLVALRDRVDRLQSRDVKLLSAALDAISQAGRNLSAGVEVEGPEVAGQMLSITRGELPNTTSAPTAPEAGGGARMESRLRVTAERLDVLLDAANHVSLLHRGLEREAEDLLHLHEEVASWLRRLLALGGEDGSATASRLGGHLGVRAVEEVPLLVQSLDRAESGIRRRLRDISVATEQVVRHSFELRLRPFADAFQPLPRLIRDLAEEMGKEIRLELHGEAVEADRAVIDVVREALLHATRNAADHGLETPEQREGAGKPRFGTITIAAELSGERVRIRVEDDGQGVDREAVRRRLEAAGFGAPQDDRALLDALFERGFSTQETPNAISGRGVGLDAVRSAIERISGSVEIHSEPGGGTTVVLECPLTLATARVLLVRVGAHAFAIPTAAVEVVRRIPRHEVRRHGAGEVVFHDDQPVTITPLGRILALPAAPDDDDPLSVAVLRHGERRLAVVVDALLDEQDAVVRSIQRGSQALPTVAGATLLADGGTAVVLNPGPVVDAGLRLESGGLAQSAQAERPRSRVLIADDSITTRTLEHSVLQSAGYEVLVAVDGMDAWQKLQEVEVDLLVSDVEMPNMDGFELCRRVRASTHLQNLPIILVTSLENEEFRIRGMEAGADAYVTKSSFDQGDLLQRVERLIGQRTA